MEPPQAHLSRHFLRAQAQRVAWLPFAAAGPPDEVTGSSTAHKLFVIGAWVEDVQQHHLSVLDLVTRLAAEGGAVEQVSLERLASWEHPGHVTALQVVDFGGGEVVIYTGTSAGALCRLRLQIPSAPGAQPDQIQVAGAGDVEGPALQLWLQLHQGPVSSISVLQDSRELLSAGLDGRLFVVSTQATTAPAAFADGGSSVSYWAAAWCSPQVFVTAGTTGGLEVWDKRAAGTPVRRSPLQWGLTGFAQQDAIQGTQRQILSLDVHPSRPYLCASGSSGGSLAVWDLRFEAEPALHALQEDTAGDVWQVRFDCGGAAEMSAEAVPPVLFCTGDGVLARTTAPMPSEPVHTKRGGGWKVGTSSVSVAEVVYREDCGSMLSFDLMSVSGRDVAIVMDQECLVYLQQPN